METPIYKKIIEAVVGYNEWAQKWKNYHYAKRDGLYGLSGREESEAIESLKPIGMPEEFREDYESVVRETQQAEEYRRQEAYEANQD